ncbi:ferredoxin reductase [Litchfieldella qijiaojingensis]|uniref:Ferredoxin reductase n=1 Tax=Litchfieldella qijiaojingensis TaxID=980347 RepID=A0ABQ2YXP2_9GAMM|nr:FAD-dependent oxidoreductase [Halomonas qijiaojingensis]GGX98653.1 ferredoxin reductase [Halomonas qijiaojingensis]
MSSSIVIVGSSLAGLRSAEQLRSQGWSGPITLVGEEEYLPYNRPPLSKQALVDASRQPVEAMHEKLAFALKPRLGEIKWLLGRRAISSDLKKQQIAFDDGNTLRYSGLVIATGLRARQLPLSGGESRRYRIRTLNDAWRLGQVLKKGCRIAIAGAGFIGCELAATARKLGCHVTVVDAAKAPLINVLGKAFSEGLLAYHRSHGVELYLDSQISEIKHDPDGGPLCLRLTDETVIDADILVEAVGAAPNTEWLVGNGLDLDNGVLCHSDLMLPGYPNVIAVGDIARFKNPLFDDSPRRIEHWNIAAETARCGVASLLCHLEGERAPAHAAPRPIVPSFWSDQFDVKIQGIGMPSLGDTVKPIAGSLDAPFTSGETFSLGYYRDGTLIGIASINGEKQQPLYRKMLLDERERLQAVGAA